MLKSRHCADQLSGTTSEADDFPALLPRQPRGSSTASSQLPERRTPSQPLRKPVQACGPLSSSVLSSWGPFFSSEISAWGLRSPSPATAPTPSPPQASGPGNVPLAWGLRSPSPASAPSPPQVSGFKFAGSNAPLPKTRPISAAKSCAPSSHCSPAQPPSGVDHSPSSPGTQIKTVGKSLGGTPNASDQSNCPANALPPKPPVRRTLQM